VYTQTYSPNDSLALLAVDSACDASDNLNWNSESDPGKWTGVTWNSENPKRVVELQVYNKSLTGSLNVSELKNLTRLRCEGNQLTNLNVSSLTELEILYCSFNLLEHIDVSGLTRLYDLECAGNPFINLELSGLPELAWLVCEGCQLTSLQLSLLPSLTDLYCGVNQLTSIDVSALPGLIFLDCSYNMLTNLNLSGLSNLYDLICRNNQFENLSFPLLPNLYYLTCPDNPLTNLDVSRLPNLYSLNCKDDQLTVLDISMAKNLTNLWCYNNQLTTLDVSMLENLELLSCANNRLPFSSLATGLHAEHIYCNPQHTLFESISLDHNTTIDYSSEALINDTPTTFVFYKYNEPVDTNTNGFFMTTGPGRYWCKMNNPLFPGLELNTSPVTIAEPSGLEDFAIYDAVVYPNPVTDQLHIRLLQQDNNLQAGIYTMDGRELLFIENVPVESEIDMSGFIPGVYILKVTSQDSQTIVRIVKN
jgi:hypothetical protein